MRPLILTFTLLACSPAFASALVVTASQGTTIDVPHDFTGYGNGFAMGTFEISNPHTAGLVLHDIMLIALQDGDDSTGLSEIGLFIDDNNSGAYEPTLDSRYGVAYTAYPVDNGSLTFTESVGFAPGETKRFIIVGKLNGAVLPAYGDTFHTIVSSISATGGTPTGLPTTFIRGANAINAPTPLRLEYDVTGSAPPHSYTFRLVLDNHSGSWAAGQEWTGPRFGQAVFGAGGTAPFVSWATDTASYPVGPFVTTPWWNSSVGGISYNSPGLFDNVAPYDDWVPTGIGDQLTWWGTANVFLNEGEMAWSMFRAGGAIVPGSASLEPAYRVGDYLRVVPAAVAPVDVGPTDTGGGMGLPLVPSTLSATPTPLR